MTNLNIDFMGKRTLALVLSVALIALSIYSLATRGLNLGIDFTGGVLVEVNYPQPADISTVRNTLTDAGFEKAQVQHFGSTRDVLIRLMPQDNVDGSALRDQIFGALSANSPGVELRRVDFVGPQVGEELTEQGGLAMLFALGMIFVYVWFRFQWKFAAGAIAALAHDVIITLGFFAFFQWDFDLSVLAAVLAVIGYSLNDTVVVFDRIRENFKRLRKHKSVDVVNISINQMLARTFITSGTTLLVLLAFYFLGGEAVRYFALALIVGIVVGTYSSIYVASAKALALKITGQDMMPVERKIVDEVEAFDA